VSRSGAVPRTRRELRRGQTAASAPIAMRVERLSSISRTRPKRSCGNDVNADGPLEIGHTERGLNGDGVSYLEV
jgi:hypothetical protein